MKNYTFLYDDACPMCQGYTSAFKQLKLSDRQAFSQIDIDNLPGLDLDRGRHEIPMLDTQTGEVRYVLDAMTEAIGEGLPILRPLVRNGVFLKALKPLYWLITYNRRVIAGTKPPVEGLDCAPDFHAGWRWTYVALALAVALAIGLPNPALLLGFGIVLVVDLWRSKVRLEFLGHFATVLLIATIICAAIPNLFGLMLAGVVAGWEGRRRL
ncbi:MAG: hypothetical protein AB8F78_18285 [Saprospiraceae bacterium]